MPYFYIGSRLEACFGIDIELYVYLSRSRHSEIVIAGLRNGVVGFLTDCHPSLARISSAVTDIDIEGGMVGTLAVTTGIRFGSDDVLEPQEVIGLAGDRVQDQITR